MPLTLKVILATILLTSSPATPFSLRRYNPFTGSKTSLTTSATRTAATKASTDDIITATTPSDKKRKIESDRVWSELKKNCVGCWSGSIVHYDVTQKCDFIAWPGKKLNFKLKVTLDKSGKAGNWVVHNNRVHGDTIAVPVGGGPPPADSRGHSIAFDNCITLALKKGNPIIIEVGFFDKLGDSMRRTAVLEYRDKNDPTQKPDRLYALHVLQQQHWKNDDNFDAESELLDDGNLHLMTDEAPFQMSDINFEKLTPTKVESIDLSTYERETMTRMNEHESKEICDSVFGRLKDDGRGITTVLKNGICMAVPFKLPDKGIEKFLFAKKYDDGSLQVMEIEYSMEPPLEPTNMNMYIFQ